MVLHIKGSTSYNALDVEAGVVPIRLRLKQVLANFGCKLLRKQDTSTLKVIMDQNFQRKNIGRSVTPADKIRMAMNAVKDRDTDFSNLEKELCNSVNFEPYIKRKLFAWKGYGKSSNRTPAQIEELQRITTNFLSSIAAEDLVCFTDGSVIDPDDAGIGPCGAGIAIYKKGLANEPIIASFKVSERSTPYHGEISAIHQALIKCITLTRKKKRENIYILSDCQSAIETVTSSCPNDNCTKEITEILQLSKEISKANTSISISWIGGHAEIIGNEIADVAAKEGAKLKTTPLSNSITLKSIKKAIQKKTMQTWQMTWDNSQTGHHLKEIQHKVTQQTNDSLPKSRNLQVIFHQLRIGRSDLNGQDPINKKEEEEKK